MSMRKSQRGFTLVEILIVVIILGILAAIVIPQFTNASQDARKSSLTSQLQTLRSQIELYKLQHGDTLPALLGGVDTAGSVVTTNWDALTTVTTYGTKSFGPYMQAPPKNPLNGLGKVVAGDGTAASANACGFIYDFTAGTPPTGTGRIYGTDTDGKAVYAE